MANSCVASLPIMMPPAALRRAVTGASAAATLSISTLECAGGRQARQQSMMSLRAKGTPCRGPRQPSGRDLALGLARGGHGDVGRQADEGVIAAVELRRSGRAGPACTRPAKACARGSSRPHRRGRGTQDRSSPCASRRRADGRRGRSPRSSASPWAACRQTRAPRRRFGRVGQVLLVELRQAGGSCDLSRAVVVHGRRRRLSATCRRS